MTDPVSVVCQNLQSYILMYFILVVIANCNIFSVLLAAEDGELLAHSTDVLRQVYTKTDPEYNRFWQMSACYWH